MNGQACLLASKARRLWKIDRVSPGRRRRYNAIGAAAANANNWRAMLLVLKDGDNMKTSIALAPLCALLALLAPPARAAEKSQIGEVIAQCAACHGAEGIAKDVEIPNLAGQHDRYLVTQLQNFRSGKRPHKEMRYMSRHITDDEIEAIAQYYSNMPH